MLWWRLHLICGLLCVCGLSLYLTSQRRNQAEPERMFSAVFPDLMHPNRRHPSILEDEASSHLSDYALRGLRAFFGARQDDVQQDFTVAMEHFAEGARQEDPFSLWMLGVCYRGGFGVKLDYRRARTHFARAARLGFADAGNDYALMLERGRGGSRNVTKAMHWFKWAAEGGAAAAYYNLGVMARSRQQEAIAMDYFLRGGRRFARQGYRLGVVRSAVHLNEMGMTLLAKSLMEQMGTSSLLLASNPMPEKHGSGSGWFVGPQHVVTCWHIIDGARNFYISDPDSGRIPLRLVARDPELDLALLEVDTEREAGSHLSLSEVMPMMGDSVFTVGFPFSEYLGESHKYSRGVLSSSGGVGRGGRQIHVSIPIQPGNSGGPLLNKSGHVVGVIAARMRDDIVYEKSGRIPQNVNLAVSVDDLKLFLQAAGVPYRMESGPLSGGVDAEGLLEICKAVVHIKVESRTRDTEL